MSEDRGQKTEVRFQVSGFRCQQRKKEQVSGFQIDDSATISTVVETWHLK
jgi:hypothetical protein